MKLKTTKCYQSHLTEKTNETFGQPNTINFPLFLLWIPSQKWAHEYTAHVNKDNSFLREEGMIRHPTANKYQVGSEFTFHLPEATRPLLSASLCSILLLSLQSFSAPETRPNGGFSPLVYKYPSQTNYNSFVSLFKILRKFN